MADQTEIPDAALDAAAAEVLCRVFREDVFPTFTPHQVAFWRETMAAAAPHLTSPLVAELEKVRDRHASAQRALIRMEKRRNELREGVLYAAGLDPDTANEDTDYVGVLRDLHDLSAKCDASPDSDHCPGELSLDGQHTADYRKRGWVCEWCGADPDETAATPPVREPRVWRSDADPEPEDTPTVKDSMGDVWTNDPRLWTTPDTQPMTWRRIAKKYGPLTEVLPAPAKEQP